MNTKEILKKVYTIKDTVKNVKFSVNETSLHVFNTISYTGLRDSFTHLVSESIITQQQYDILFSEAMRKELRPYKGELMHLKDIDLGIISKDYFLSIMSYIIGVSIPNESSFTARNNAKNFAVKNFGVTGELINLNNMINYDTFIFNNLDRIINAYRNEQYHHYSIPIGYNEDLKYITIYLSGDVPTLSEIKEEMHQYASQGTKLFDTFFNTSNSIITITSFIDFIETYMYCTKMTLDDIDLDFSPELSQEGRSNLENYYIPYPDKDYWREKYRDLYGDLEEDSYYDYY